jgi:hypothetical protein
LILSTVTNHCPRPGKREWPKKRYERDCVCVCERDFPREREREREREKERKIER